MKRPSTVLILSGVIIILAIALIGTLLFVKNQPSQARGIPLLTEVSNLEPDSSRWGLNFPNQYSSLLLTKNNATRTVFGGSEDFSKLEEDSRLVTLFAGYGFSKDYNEDRGHMNSLDDVRSTLRVGENTPGTCYSCKSSNNPKLWDEMGPADFFSTSFMELGQHISNPIGCANCHEAETMRLVVTNPALEEALQAQGKDWTEFTRQEMRTVVCANCHVEYYFAGEGKYLTFPWSDGTNVDQIAEYYAGLEFADWTYPDTGTPMIKIQHPEYEMYTQDSTHYSAGVACADCHMPYTRDGAAKYSDHNVKSPLLNAEVACGQCHTNVNYVTTRVATIQQQVNVTMIATEDAIISAVDAIKVVADSAGVDGEMLDEARSLHREAQLRWDFVAAENSMGFHNPEEALRMLAKATDQARQAELKALQAGGSQALLRSVLP